MWISVSPPICPPVPKEDVTVVGVGSIQQTEVVPRCITWDIGATLLAPRSPHLCLNVSSLTVCIDADEIQHSYPGNAISRTMSATVLLVASSLIIGFRLSRLYLL
jgi:hypothetical protein